MVKNMKKIIGLGLLMFGAMAQASDDSSPDVIMPTEEVLKGCLKDIKLDPLKDSHLGSFLGKTNLASELAGKKLPAKDVLEAVETAVFGYCEEMKHPGISLVMTLSQPRIVKAVLRDHPDAITQLRADGLLK